MWTCTECPTENGKPVETYWKCTEHPGKSKLSVVSSKEASHEEEDFQRELRCTD